MMRTKQFTYKGRTLEVRAAPLEDGWVVRLYEGNRQISPIRYNVAHELAIDAATQKFSLDLIQDLMDLVQREVESGQIALLPLK